MTPDYVGAGAGGGGGGGGGMPSVGTETTPPGGQEESCASFAGYDYNARLGNGYKFNGGATGNYASYPSNGTPPAAPHQVLFTITCSILFV